MNAKRALDGIRVLDFSNVRTGAQASQTLADFGADVVHVEPAGGSPMRSEAAWTLWARGKRSIQLDLRDEKDLAIAQDLACGADVLIETWRPGVAERMGLGYEQLASFNPALIHASITGFGRRGPYADLQGYEAVVLAKTGAFWSMEEMLPRGGPVFSSLAACSYPASQVALQGILAALYERGAGGVGQKVETSLAQGFTVYDSFNWFARLFAQRQPGGQRETPRVANGVPTIGLTFRILAALTRDGRWLQFSQSSERLFRAMMKLFELDWMFDDPVWKTAPEFAEEKQREAFWEQLLTKVRERTADEWLDAFNKHPDVWGERLHEGAETLLHQQMIWNRMVTETSDPERGRVRTLAAIARMDGTPAHVDRPPPRLGAHDDEIRSEAQGLRPRLAERRTDQAPHPPLSGLTVVELGTFYAGPYGATLLAELGARVIKLEQLDGDPHRHVLPFPEAGGIKGLLGKDCVAVDLSTEQGRGIAHRILSKADIVLQSFRAGAAERLGLDAKTVRRLNPNVVYHSAPGYGEDGPYGRRPAFAPTIAAAAGWAWRIAGKAIPARADMSLAEIKPAALQLRTALVGSANADGASAATAATAMLLGLVARQRGYGGQQSLTTMISSAAHTVSEMMIEYEGAPAPPEADVGLYGWSALYRLYPAADGEWVFLAAPKAKEWGRLTSALPDGGELMRDPNFTTEQSRQINNLILTQRLAEIFATRAAAEWERGLRAVDIACVVVARGPIEANYMDPGGLGDACGLITDTNHPILGKAIRPAALVEFSRSTTVLGDAGLIGQDTERVLLDHGYEPAELEAFETAGVILQARQRVEA